MDENELSKVILDSSFRIHKELGPGIFESVYESILEYELMHEYGFDVRRQSPVDVCWKGIRLDIGFRADLVVENKVIVEIKSIDALAAIHPKQVLTYLRLTGLKLGLLINFN